MIECTLESAERSDRNEILMLIRHVVEHLNRIGIYQWDELYPRASDVDEDIGKGELYVARSQRRIVGIITLNRESDPEYQNGKWTYQGTDFMVVHRLCVSPAMQGQGLGTQIMQMTEAMLHKDGIKSIRLDTFSQNPYSMRLYDKLGFRITGEAVWRKGLFYLMEKDITAWRSEVECPQGE